LPILLIFSILCPLIPLIAGIKKRFTLLWLYVMTGFCFDLVVVTQKRLLHVNQHPASNLFVLVEFILISALFVADTLNKTIYDLNAFFASFFSLAYILYAITGFYVVLQKQKVLFLEKSSFFWINVAFLVYASGNLLLFLFKDYLRQNNAEFFGLLWHTFFLVLNISKNIFLAIALSSKTVDIEHN
jgi:hypothetical protein